MTKFLDLAFDELNKAAPSVSESKLQALLDATIALHTPAPPSSNSNNSLNQIVDGSLKFREDVRISMADMTNVKQLIRIICVLDDDKGMEGLDSKEEYTGGRPLTGTVNIDFRLAFIFFGFSGSFPN